MRSSTFANALSFSVFQNTSHLETNFLSKQLYFQISSDYTDIRAATFGSYFFTKRFILEHVVVWNSYFFLITTSWQQILFSDQLLLEDKYFFNSTAAVVFWRSYFFRISDCSKHVLFRSRQFLRTAAVLEEEPF